MEDRNITEEDRVCPQLPEFDEKANEQTDLKKMKPVRSDFQIFS